MDDNEKEVVNNFLTLAKFAMILMAIVSGAVGQEMLL